MRFGKCSSSWGITGAALHCNAVEITSKNDEGAGWLTDSCTCFPVEFVSRMPCFGTGIYFNRADSAIIIQPEHFTKEAQVRLAFSACTASLKQSFNDS